MNDFKGSYLGFTYDGVHSSDLGIVRVSNGGRYSENILPDIQDKTIQVPGGDGTYYFGSVYTKKSFSIAIAFDNLSNEQFNKMRQLFGAKGIHSLIFDENPYKVYLVKTTGNPNLKYICFDKTDDFSTTMDRKEDLYGSIGEDFYEGMSFQNKNGRIYKGDGTLNFTAYNPYAKSRFKYIEDYTADNIYEWKSLTNYINALGNTSFYEWIHAANLLSKTYYKDNGYVLDIPTTTKCLVYNPGDLDTPFNFIIKPTANNKIIPSTKLQLGDKLINCATFSLDSRDSGIRINSKLHLIEGIDNNNKPTGIVYNQFITSGDFFKIPVMKPGYIIITLGNNTLTADNLSIEYDYLYL